MARYRNYRNFYPSGVVPAETQTGRFLQKAEETIRPYVSYARIPVTAAAVLASTYPVYKEIREIYDDTDKVTKHLFREYIDIESAKKDDEFKLFKERWGKKAANKLLRELDKSFQKNREARENAPEHGTRRRTLADFTALAPSNLREFWRSRRDPKGYEEELTEELERRMPQKPSSFRDDPLNIIIEPELGDIDSGEE